jgi:ariadne-1
MCMGLWSEHGTSWYNCNRFEEKSGHDARSAQAKSRASLERNRQSWIRTFTSRPRRR